MRLSGVLSVATVLNVVSSGHNELSDFFGAAMSAFSLRRPIHIVTDADECWPPHAPNNSDYLQCIVYYKRGVEQEVVNQLEASTGLYDTLLFIGVKFDQLLEHIDKATDILHSGVVTLVDKNQAVNISLRLDTNILQYQRISNSEYSISEEYAIKHGVVNLTQTLGKWTPQNGLRLFLSPVRWVRRADLRGVRLQDTIMADKITCEIKYDEDGNIVRTGGLTQDVFNALQARLNFTAEQSIPPDFTWGSLGADGVTWNGQIGLLAKRGADIASSGLSQTFERGIVTGFSIPLLDFKITLIAPVSKETAINFWVYLDIFTIGSWACILAVLLATIVAFWIMLQRYSNTISLRILFLTSSIATYLLFSHYATDLTARMTSGPPRSSIKSFDDLMRGGPFLQVITFPNSAESSLLEFARDGASMKAYWNAYMAGKKNAFLATTEAAVEHILNNPGTLFFGPHTIAAGDPRLVALDLSDSVRVGAGFTYPPDSEFRAMFDFHLLKLIQSGVVHNMQVKYFTPPPLTIGVQEAESVGYDNMLFIFILLAFGIGVSFVMLSYEHCGNRSG